MRKLTKVLAGGEAGPAAAGRAGAARMTLSVTLSFLDRRRSRQRVRLDDGSEAALLLPRGTVLHDGDLVMAEDDGEPLAVTVRAAPETLSVARTSDGHLLTRAAYHLGNRHVPLQIGTGRLAYGHDHVLDDLVRKLGLDVAVESGPFEPEGGGYAHAHAHHHGHDHDHD